jgi:hypothetical protein
MRIREEYVLGNGSLCSNKGIGNMIGGMHDVALWHLARAGAWALSSGVASSDWLIQEDICTIPVGLEVTQKQTCDEYSDREKRNSKRR